MARDYEDIHDIDDLSDDELSALVREHLRGNASIDADDISVRATDDGVVFLNGRVGTEAEMRIAERVLTDVLGLTDVRNELVVDPIRRAESPIDPDEHAAENDAQEGLLLGDVPPQSDDYDALESGDDSAQLFGTTDVQQSISSGAAYIPPTTPTPEGLSGTDAGPGTMGEDH
jgi:hypothetical protein